MSQQRLRRVVLIDDDSFDNKANVRMMHRAGLTVEVITFTMAEDALTWFRRFGVRHADLVLLDIRLPRMDGFEFLEAMKAEFGSRFDEAAVILMTSSLHPVDRGRALGFPAVRACLHKPLTRAMLEQTMDDIGAGAVKLAG